jgi:hypothetical protein
MVMIDAAGRQKYFVAKVSIEIKRSTTKIVFNEHDDMTAYREQLEEKLSAFIGSSPELLGAEVRVSIGSYACGTIEALKKSGEWV